MADRRVKISDATLKKRKEEQWDSEILPGALTAKGIHTSNGGKNYSIKRETEVKVENGKTLRETIFKLQS